MSQAWAWPLTLQALPPVCVSVCGCEGRPLPADFPDSRPAVEDLKYCLERTDQRQQLLVSLKAALETRLLHPGTGRPPIDFRAQNRRRRVQSPSHLQALGGGGKEQFWGALGGVGLVVGWCPSPRHRLLAGGVWWLRSRACSRLALQISWLAGATLVLPSPQPPVPAAGVNTCDIITLYISAIKALRVLDPSMVILEVACEPVRRYLR